MTKIKQDYKDHKSAWEPTVRESVLLLSLVILLHIVGSGMI